MIAATHRARTSTARVPKSERPISDMAHEMLTRVIAGLSTVIVLDKRDREVLYHYLFGRDSERVATELDLRETTVHKHLHYVFLRTQTTNRRALLQLGLALADQAQLDARGRRAAA
jgi:DNA-binding NarL/FixJ family response regulator